MRTTRRAHRRNTRHFALQPLEQRTLLSVAANEQLFVYLLNRARHDPQAYQVEQALPIDLSGVAAQPPLAVNDSLFASAQFHSAEMAANDYFAHQSTVTGDWPNKMVRDAGYPLPAEFIINDLIYGVPNNSNQVESIAGGYSTAQVALNELIVDTGVPSLGHRKHLLGMDEFNAPNREIGVGYGYNAASYYEHYWTAHLARVTGDEKFLTGVVFNDQNGNQRYDLNEGLPGVTVSAGAGLTAITNAAGGYAIQVATSGEYEVTASGGGFTGTSLGAVTLGADSIEVDFISGIPGAYVGFAYAGNTAPTLAAGTYYFKPILQNTVNPVANTFEFLASAITDPDPAAQQGVAVVGLAGAASGTWEFSTNSGTTWTAIDAPTDVSALLLRDIDMVRFIPNNGFSGSVSLTVRAWDRTSGSAGQRVNLSGATGGSSAYSASTRAITLGVLASNTAPTLNTAPSPTLTGCSEDATNPSGTPVRTLAAGATDPDLGTRAGLAIIAATGASNGTWQYSLDSGVTWTALGTPSGSAARLLRDSDLVRFLPNTNFNGSATITFRAWDQTTGTAGATVDLGGTGTGGSTAFSAASDSASITVSPVNDAPVLDNTNVPWMKAVPVNTPFNSIVTYASTASSLISGLTTDVDTATLGISIISVTGNGIWYVNYSGNSWLQWDPVDAAHAMPIGATNRLAFIPAAGWTGTASVTYRAWDLTTGTTGTQVNISSPSSVGGTTAYSAATDTAYVYVHAANITPVTLSGSVFNDADGDATKDAGEVGLPGWTVYLDTNNNTQLDAEERRTASAADGSYSFANMPAGTYRIRQIRQNGWQRTTAEVYTRTLTSGGASTNNHFGNSVSPTNISISDISVNEQDAGTVNATFNISISPALNEALTITYNTVAGTATAGADFKSASQTVTIPANTTSYPIIVSIIPDTIDEDDETFSLVLSNASAGNIARSTAVCQILDNDAPSLIAIGNVRIVEGDSGASSAVLTLTLSAATERDIAVTYTTVAGTAVAGSDFTTTTGRATFARLATTTTISIPIVGELLDEVGDEVFYVDISSPAFAAIDSKANRGTVTIEDNDTSAVSLGVADSPFSEQSGVGQIVATLSGPSTRDVTAQIAFSGSALHPGDYTGQVPTILIPAGATSASINLTGVPDGSLEGEETIIVNLTGVTNGILGAVQQVTAIVSDDLIAHTPSVTNATALEDTQTSSGLVITRNASDGAWVTHFKITNIAGGTLYQHDGTTPITSGDFIEVAAGTAGLRFTPAANSTGPGGFDVQASVSASDGGLNGGVVSATITITPVNDAPLLDGSGAPAVPTITHSSATNPGMSIPELLAACAGGNPINDVDAGALQGIAIVAADSTRGSWMYTIDSGATWAALGTMSAANARLLTADPANRLKFVPASAAGAVANALTFRAWDQTTGSNGSLASAASNGGTTAFSLATETVSLLVLPTVNVTTPSVTEGNSGTKNLAFTVSLSAASNQTVQVRYGAANGTATVGSDFNKTGGWLTFTPGQTSQVINVPVRGDTAVEGNETVLLNLASPVAAVLSRTQTTGTIMNDDGALIRVYRMVGSKHYEVRDGQSGAVSFGSVQQKATPPVWTFRIYNTGTQTLRLGKPTVPAGYAITDALASSISPGQYDTFKVKLNTGWIGTFAGSIRFSSNVISYNPFNFPVTGTVTARVASSAVAKPAANTVLEFSRPTAGLFAR